MRSFARTLAVSGIALATAPAMAVFAHAADNLYDRSNVDWSEVTGSIASATAPYFQLAPVPQADDGLLTTTLQRLPTDARQLRFEGEVGRRHIPLYLRKEQVTEPAKLHLKYLNAVAVMPEASRMTVSINDRVIAEIALDASSETASAVIPVPPGLLEAGYNALSFHVQQRHRVDCSIEAASELWTQVDPTGTGLSVSATSDVVSRFEDLVALPVGEDGSTPITIMLSPSADNAAIDQSIRAAQALAIRAGFARPKISFTREATTAPGIQLYVGTTKDLRARGVDLSPVGDTAFSISGRLSGAVRITVGGASPADVDQSIFRLVVERTSKGEIGSAAGLRALARTRGYRLDPEKEVSFADIGAVSEDFTGRVYRADFNVILPPDFYPADNGKATLFLDATYVPGLVTSNEALVRVNGKVFGASRLTRSGGETLTRRPIELTLKALQPGFNTVQLEVRTATEDDKDCNPLSLIEPKKRLSVQDTTSFALPRLSRINHLPNMAATASTGFPYTETRKPITLYMPRPDLGTLGAAATLLVRQAMAAGRPLDTRLVQRAPDAASGSALVVAALGDLSPEMISYFGIKNDMLPPNWLKPQGKPGEAGKQAEAPAAREGFQLARLSQPADPSAAPSGDAGIGTAEKDDKPRWGVKTDERSFGDRFRQGLISFLTRNIGYSADQLSFLNGDKSTVTASRTTKLVMAQQQGMAGGNTTWTLLTGPDAATLQRDTIGLVSQTSWNQISGRMVSYDPSVAELTHFPEGHHYHYDLRDWSFSNVTLMAAGWLSNHIQYYVLVILMMCGIFGVFTRKLLNRIGAQS